MISKKVRSFLAICLLAAGGTACGSAAETANRANKAVNYSTDYRYDTGVTDRNNNTNRTATNKSVARRNAASISNLGRNYSPSRGTVNRTGNTAINRTTNRTGNTAANRTNRGYVATAPNNNRNRNITMSPTPSGTGLFTPSLPGTAATNVRNAVGNRAIAPATSVNRATNNTIAPATSVKRTVANTAPVNAARKTTTGSAVNTAKTTTTR